MSYSDILLFSVILLIGQGFIIVGQYKEISLLRKRISDAVRLLKPEKPKKEVVKKNASFWNIKRQ